MVYKSATMIVPWDGLLFKPGFHLTGHHPDDWDAARRRPDSGALSLPSN
jgi:hypothetical protein